MQDVVDDPVASAAAVLSTTAQKLNATSSLVPSENINKAALSQYGSGVGTGVGARVGDAVGAAVGCAVGAAFGAKVSAAVGVTGRVSPVGCHRSMHQ